jgi:hypothetical protein
MRTKKMRIVQNNCPVVKGIEEERFYLHHHPLTVFKISIISFSPETPQKDRWYHLSHYCTLRTATQPSSTSEKDYHSSKHNPS